MYLSTNQILYIENDLKSKGLSKSRITSEIIDHVCCQVEEHMKQGLDFSIAYSESLRAFNDEGFIDLKKELNQPAKRIWSKKIVTSGIAACILLFVFVVDAQDRPEVHPLGSENRISSKFGMRIHPITKKEKFHRGVDMPTPIGTPIKVAATGFISEVKESKGYGKYVIVKHDEEFETLYATLSDVKVSVGDRVLKGEVIALSGNSGVSTAPHLHYEVLRNGKNVDPKNYFD